jgi:hypothetical protein
MQIIRAVTFLAAIGLLGAATIGARAGMEGGTVLAPKTGFGDLMLTLAAYKDPVFPLEPVLIRVTIANKTDRPIAVPASLATMQGELIEFQVAQPGKEFERFTGLDMAWLLNTNDHFRDMLERETERSFTGFLYYGRAKSNSNWQYLFPVSGTYRVKATLAGAQDGARVTSNMLAIHATSPQGEDASACAVLKTTPHKAFLLLREVFGDSLKVARTRPVFADLEAFTVRFPKSQYCLYGQLAIGSAYSNSHEPADLERAVSLLEKVAAADSCLRWQALCSLIDVYIRAGGQEKAKQAFRTLAESAFDTRIVWQVGERLVRNIQQISLVHEVTIDLQADGPLEAWQQVRPTFGISVDSAELGYFPVAGRVLAGPDAFKQPLIFKLPAGVYRLSLRRHEAQVSLQAPVVLVDKVTVDGPKRIAVAVKPEHIVAIKNPKR